MNNSAKFQLHPLMAPEEMIFFIFFPHKFSLYSVSMATNQLQRFGQNSYVW